MTGPSGRGAVLRSPGMPALLVVTTAGFSGYAALIAVAPLWAVHGGADEVGAGLVNAVLLLSTVAAQTGVPWALNRFGHPVVIGVGLALLGLPALGYNLSDALGPVLLMSALRGVGFAVLTVTGSAMVAVLVPPDRLGAAIGLYGLGVALPMLVWLPLSVPLADGVGFWAVFALGALPLAGIPAVGSLGRAVAGRHRSAAVPADAPSSTAGEAVENPDGVDRSALTHLLRRVGPSMVILLSVTLVGGAIMTFLPQLVGSSRLAAGSLFLLSLGAAVSRWLAGTLADRTGPRPYLVPLLLLTSAGMAALAWWVHASPPAWLLLVIVAVIGFGYGALQNLTLVVAFQAVPRERVNQASAAWNIGFDAGTGLGALVTGYLAAGFSFPVAFGVLAAVCATALVAVRAVPAQAR
ncbi:MAG TPA: MFS transporter [Pseudonocardia sp.]|nr:MFS transporter [Pseudonocardia sp.]